ncbi:MAG TPA: replication factor C large subunit [Methanobacterium subterraneum]|uniref:Replication factor C large subunit n=1 Tax=Methanobacterium subterraneum TaxID=59277 RepID=A0A7J4TJE8_9EURY|nr:replication factor C large subunit [Methanobacterium subterraneum]
MLWTEKYSPQTMKDVLGNKKAIEEIENWLENWDHGEPQKCLLLVGPPGTGKTTLAHLVAQQFSDHIELNASDKRSYDIIMNTIGEASASVSLFGQGGLKLIILDEVDGLHGNEDRGGIRAINKIIKEGHHPMIMMANDLYSKRIQGLKSKCQLIKIRKVHTNSIVALLKKICVKEGVDFEEHVLRTLAKRSRGDLRSAINDLQVIAQGKDSITSDDLKAIAEKDNINNIFDSVRTVLKSKNPKRIKDSLRLEADPGFILEQITENIPREYEKAEEIEKAYNAVAEADVYLGRAFHTRHYGYWKYTYDLMGVGVALAKDETYKKFSRYSSSTFYSKLSKNRAKRDLRDRVATKIGAKMHTSRKVAIEYFPYFEIMFQGDELARDLADYFDLEDAEVKQFRSRKIKIRKPKKATKAKTTSKPKTTTSKTTKSTKNPSSKRPSETAVTGNDPVVDTDSSSKKASKTNDSETPITSKDPKTSKKTKKGKISKSAESKDKNDSESDSEKSESKEKGKQTSLFSFQ